MLGVTEGLNDLRDAGIELTLKTYIRSPDEFLQCLKQLISGSLKRVNIEEHPQNTQPMFEDRSNNVQPKFDVKKSLKIIFYVCLIAIAIKVFIRL